MRYTSPQGEVLDVPAGGGHALIALGWKPDAEPEKQQQERKPTRRRRVTSSDNTD